MPKASSLSLSDAALELARRNFCVFPVRQQDKKPAIKEWQKEATTELSIVKSWWSSLPSANIGLATGSKSGVFVLDVDGEQGKLALDTWIKEHGKGWTDTLRVKTKKGFHFYFQYPDNAEIRNSVGKIAVGLDIRGEGGFVVAPPSIHPEGDVYQWLSKTTDVLAPAPEWLLASIFAASSNTTAPGKDNTDSAPFGDSKIISEGSRNDYLARHAGTLRRSGMGRDEIEVALQVINKKRCLPPLGEKEVRTIAGSIARYEPAVSLGEDPRDQYFERPLAEKFASQYGEKARIRDSGDWITYKNGIWLVDKHAGVRAVGAFLKKEMPSWPEGKRVKTKTKAIDSLRKRLSSAACTHNVVSLAASQPQLFIASEDLDKDPFLLGCPGGLVVDLRTGKKRPALPSDYITKTVTVAPDARVGCKLWRKTISEIFEGNPELIAYIQRVLGSCLTGSVRDEALFIFKGSGRNGKGTLVGAVQTILGPYSTAITKEALSESKFKNDYAQLGSIAKLLGARIAVSSEGNKTIRMDTELLKNLTGRDRLIGKKMHRDQFEFDPTHKLILLANHNPQLDIDPAVIGRLHLVPFKREFKDHPNTKLKDQLVEEYPGILTWLIEGCLSWQKIGLQPPKIVMTFTEEYLQSADLFEQWAASEGHTKDPKFFAPSQLLFDDWCNYCDSVKEKPGTFAIFHSDLKKKPWIREGRTRFPKKGKERNGFWGLRTDILEEKSKREDSGVRKYL